MIQLAHAKLRVGGLIALETPNPECLAIFATHFYIDPTHRHPIPPALTSFYLEEAGFGRIEIERLSPAIESMPSVAELPEGFRKEFFGSLDYAAFGNQAGLIRDPATSASACTQNAVDTGFTNGSVFPLLAAEQESAGSDLKTRGLFRLMRGGCFIERQHSMGFAEQPRPQQLRVHIGARENEARSREAARPCGSTPSRNASSALRRGRAPAAALPGNIA